MGLKVSKHLNWTNSTMDKIPRAKDDYTRTMATARREFINEKQGSQLHHTGNYSLPPESVRGNIENFSGVTQIPMGLCGPLLVKGDKAKGTFYVPMATTEGTLVGSYNRGMKLIRAAGGVQTTIIAAAMQRSPVFGFDNATTALLFGKWIAENEDKIRTQAEATSSVVKLQNIQQHAVSKFRFLRFNFSTGDAAGQNMTSKATAAACEFITKNYPNIEYFSLSGNFCTDKKYSLLNTLHTRGKKVVAEATIPASLIKEQMHTTPMALFKHRQVSNVGSFMAGTNNNGLHSANALAAIFTATGQDIANLAESSSAIVYTDVTADGSYYFSITLPSLIVATYGGGTGLATQKECLELLDCYGKDRAEKFAEIIAATVLCGELSLSSAVVTRQWIDSHERLGRNR